MEGAVRKSTVTDIFGVATKQIASFTSVDCGQGR